MESEKHKESRFRDGGITSDVCKCGRPWKTKHLNSVAYCRICPGCHRPTRNCNCEPLAN